MKTKKIESELKKLCQDLKGLARQMGISNFAKETNVNSKDVSAWLNGHRDFSYEKMIRIALVIDDRVLEYRKTH